MSKSSKPLRVLFCGAVLQNFFDLQSEEIPGVLMACGGMFKKLREMDGIDVLGTLDDDETMVGTSPDGFPWTFYILADAKDRETVVAACNLLRESKIGVHRLWRYMRWEARIGRELAMPEPQ